MKSYPAKFKSSSGKMLKWDSIHTNSLVFVKYIWNNSYLYCGCRWKWRVIISVNFPRVRIPLKSWFFFQAYSFQLLTEIGTFTAMITLHIQKAILPLRVYHKKCVKYVQLKSSCPSVHLCLSLTLLQLYLPKAWCFIDENNKPSNSRKHPFISRNII